MSKINYICKWIFFAISNFTITEKVASRNSSEVVYIGDLSRHWIISKGTQIPKGIGWYKLKPATKPTVVVESNLFKLQNSKSRHYTSLVFSSELVIMFGRLYSRRFRVCPKPAYANSGDVIY